MHTLYDNFNKVQLQAALKYIKKMVNQVKSWNNISTKLKEFYQAVDEIQSKDIGLKFTSCKKGCSFCCYYNVDVSEPEAKLLVPFVTPEMFEQINKQANLSVEQFNKLPLIEKRCIFLKDNQCSVYENRPLACRRYFVKSNPSKCDTGIGVQQIIQAVNIEAVLSIDAFHEVYPNTKNLSTHLKSLLKC